MYAISGATRSDAYPLQGPWASGQNRLRCTLRSVFGRGKKAGGTPSHASEFIIAVEPDASAQKEAREAGKKAGKKEQPGLQYLPPYLEELRSGVRGANANRAEQTEAAADQPMHRVVAEMSPFNRSAVKRVLRDLNSVDKFIERFDKNKEIALTGLAALEAAFLTEAELLWGRRGLHWTIPEFRDVDEIKRLREEISTLRSRWEAADNDAASRG